MSLSFTRAPTVAPGDPVTSEQLRLLARAINDRIRSGIGDMAWRIVMYWFNLTRQVRNSDETGFVFPTQAELWEIYQLLDPENNPGQWPETGPGEPEGANVANPLMQFVFGLDGSLSSEEGRISDPVVPLWLGSFEEGFHPPQTLEEFWALGKLQRGAIDAVTGLQYVPAFEAAQSFFRITAPWVSPHGKSYGGYFPTPNELLSNCGATSDDIGWGIASKQIKFTALRSDVDTSDLHGALGSDPTTGFPTITYAGSCPQDSDYTDAGHVWAIAELPFATYVAVNDGSGENIHLDRFDVKDWIQGPYTEAGELSRADGGQIERAVWAFLADFRGTVAQRAKDDFEIEKIAFDNQAFFEGQYYLAPNRAVISGDSLEAQYPTATISGAQPSGTYLPFTNGTQEHFYAPGFVLAGIFAKATDLAAPISIEVMDGSKVIATLPLTIAQPEALKWLPTQLAPAPLKVRIKGELKFSAPEGQLTFEASEQMEYLPEYWDGYLITRLAATKGGDQFRNGVDGRGRDTSFAREIFKDYAKYGCIVNRAAAGVRSQADWVNDNPVYDAARRLTRDHARIVSPREFLSYEVTGGKTILRFKRYAYGLDGQRADCFIGIAPSYKPMVSGELVHGEVYIVRGAGSVTYRGSGYSDGQQLTADKADKTFNTAGDAKLYEYEGIKPAAREKGLSNEWVSFIETKVYHWSESSIWKRDAYGYYFAWNNRCHFSHYNPLPGDFARHINYGHSVNVEERSDASGYDMSRIPERVRAEAIAPEAPSGYNFNGGANGGADADFYRSCQIYKPPYEIESATVEFDPGGAEIVKLVFKSRCQSHADAPATVDPDPLTWSSGEQDDLQAESYRTDDNALREYARLIRGDGAHASWKIGDSAYESIVQFTPDNPYGSVIPHFFFTRLISEPFADENNEFDPHDTRCTIDPLLHAEVALRAGCEGFVDGQTSLDITCQKIAAAHGDPGSLYDYRWQNLCFEAFGGRGIGAFSLAARADGPAGHGPLPNTWQYAEVYNRLAQAANLLTKARVELPYAVEWRTEVREGYRSLTNGEVWPEGIYDNCVPYPNEAKAVWTGMPPAANTVTSPWGDWTEAFGASAHLSCGLANTCDASDNWQTATSKTLAQMRVSIDADALLAVPVTWRDDISSFGSILATRTYEKYRSYCQASSDSNDGDGCGGTEVGFFWDGAVAYHCEETLIEDTTECILMVSGVIDPGGPFWGDFRFGRNADGINTAECPSSNSVNITVAAISTPAMFITIPLV